MGFNKWPVLCLMALVVLLAGWIVVGSIDADTVDDRGLLSELKQVPDEQNGFLDIDYMGGENFKISGESHLKDIAQGKQWNGNEVEAILQANRAVIDSVVASNKKPLFKFPEIHGIMDKLFPYQRLTAANRLLIIKSRWHTNNLDYDSAIDAVNQAMEFSEHIKSEESGYLISWAIGIVMQAEILDWVHYLVSNYDLSYENHARIFKVIKIINPYEEDEFRKVLIGEMKASSEIVNEINSKSFIGRIEDYIEIQKIRSSFGLDNNLSGVKEYIFEYMNLLFPKFYLHANRINSIHANHIREQVEKVDHYCNSWAVPEEKPVDFYYAWPKNPDFIDLFRSNSREKYLAEQFADNFYNYYQRRCFFHVYKEGVKTALAIRMYQREHNGALPESLDMLVPHYLEVRPVDYFDGRPLRYSREKQWLYSVGADGKDDGGSPEGLYQGRCTKEGSCYNSPTIPLVVTPPQTEPSGKQEACEQE